MTTRHRRHDRAPAPRGPGDSSAYFTGRFAPDSAAVAARIGLGDTLAARRPLHKRRYTRLELHS